MLDPHVSPGERRMSKTRTNDGDWDREKEGRDYPGTSSSDCRCTRLGAGQAAERYKWRDGETKARDGDAKTDSDSGRTGDHKEGLTGWAPCAGDSSWAWFCRGTQSNLGGLRVQAPSHSRSTSEAVQGVLLSSAGAPGAGRRFYVFRHLLGVKAIVRSLSENIMREGRISTLLISTVLPKELGSLNQKPL